MQGETVPHVAAVQTVACLLAAPPFWPFCVLACPKNQLVWPCAARACFASCEELRCFVTAPAGEGVDALFLPVTSCRSCLVSGGGALLLGMCNWLCLPRQYVSTCFFRPSCSRGQFHDLIDICLAWQSSLPGCESRRVHGCIIADLCFSTHMCHEKKKKKKKQR